MTDATPSRQRHHTVTIVRPPVLKHLLWFWSLLALAAGGSWLLDPQVGLSLLWGLATSALPGFCFAWYGLRRLGGARQSREALHGLYRAEAIRFVFTAALFAAVFLQVEQIHLTAYFVAFVGAHLSASLVTARALNRRRAGSTER